MQKQARCAQNAGHRRVMIWPLTAQAEKQNLKKLRKSAEHVFKKN